MNPDDDPKNWVPAMETDKGVSASTVTDHDSPENWVAAEGTTKGTTAYDEFKASKPQQEEKAPLANDRVTKTPLKPKEGQLKDNIQDLPAGMAGKTFSYPFDHHLNAVVDSAVGSMWNTFVKPIIGKDDKYVDAYLEHINKEHPIASVVGGSAPFIATAPLVPEALVPKLWARLSVQFGGVGFLNALGAVRTEESNRSGVEKAQTVAVETGKQAAAGPIFAKAQLLKIAERPFATALAQSGIITGGVGAMNTFFGDNVVEAFKQSGILGVVNLAFHSPELLKTAIGRGSAAKLSKDSGVTINPDASPEEVKKQINQAVDVIEKQNPKLTEPHIISATVKLSDGTDIHGASHEDALSKIGLNKPVYHGTGIKFDQFEESMKGSITGAKSAKGAIWFTDDPKVAKAYSVYAAETGEVTKLMEAANKQEKIAQKTGKKEDWDKHDELMRQAEEADNADNRFERRKNANVKEAVLHGDFLTVDAEGKTPQELSKDNDIDSWLNEQIKIAKKQGKDGIIIKNLDDAVGLYNAPATHYAVFDPKNIKTVQAGFTVQYPDGKTRFVNREEAMKEFNLPTGEAKDVPGLQESKFSPQPEPLKIVNPATLEQIKGLGEEGKMDVNMIPGVAEAAEILQRSHAELKEKLAPYTVGKEGEYTAATLRENLGIMARNHDMLENALSQAKKTFDKANKESSLDFINKMESGEKQSDPNLEKVANTLRTMLDTKRDEIRALGTGKLENYIENYFPHIWESPNKAMDVIKSIMGRRPFEGSNRF